VNFNGGVFVAAGHFLLGGGVDIVTGAGAGGGPNVGVFHIQADGFANRFGGPLGSFFAFDPGFTGGVTVAAGNLDGNGLDSIITGAGPGGGPQVNVFNGADASLRLSFFAYSSTSLGGVFVSAGPVGAGPRDLIFTGQGT